MTTQDNGKRYIYEWLKPAASAIRLLSLNPVAETDPLSCNLRTDDLNLCPTYIAVSYEWGEVEPQVEITVNGLSIFIRHNVWLFLSVVMAKQRRKELAKSLLLWIDAVCIDQEDLSGRNAQVSMMGTIYGKTTSVFAWLGWAQGWDPKVVFKFIDHGYQALPADRLNLEQFVFLGLTYDKVARMILQTCQCRYWSRHWVVQEILLARDVIIMCGEDDLSFTSLQSFATRLAIRHDLQDLSTIKAMKGTVPFTMIRYKYGSEENHLRMAELTIRQLLTEFRTTDCEIPHDKVYSLLSLASDGHRLSVDYGCSSLQLLWRVISEDGWSWKEEVELLAEDLSVSDLLPNKFRRCEVLKEPNELSLSLKDNCNIVVTHRLVFNSTPFSFTRDDFQYLYSIMARSTRHSHDYQRWHEIDTLLEFIDRAEGSRILVCKDGRMGLACLSARDGDLLCDFIPGRKLVVRTEHDDVLRPIGTAILPLTFLKTDALLSLVTNIAEQALWDQQYNDFLQLDCSAGGSTVADILLNMERGLLSSIISSISSFVSASKPHGIKSNCCELNGSITQRTMRGSFNLSDMIALATSTSATLIDLDIRVTKHLI